MQKGRKPDSSRLTLFYIIHVLQRYSDREHPISVSEIQEKINLKPPAGNPTIKRLQLAVVDEKVI